MYICITCLHIYTYIHGGCCGRSASSSPSASSALGTVVVRHPRYSRNKTTEAAADAPHLRPSAPLRHHPVSVSAAFRFTFCSFTGSPFWNRARFVMLPASLFDVLADSESRRFEIRFPKFRNSKHCFSNYVFHFAGAKALQYRYNRGFDDNYSYTYNNSNSNNQQTTIQMMIMKIIQLITCPKASNNNDDVMVIRSVMIILVCTEY